ncbi:MAG: DoxX family membrane protein [Candidatus Lambdaproteobacteria bacterium]|nr:DoxX family membrane protein [Candidatus Lambdaproteobacteria bacterium]
MSDFFASGLDVRLLLRLLVTAFLAVLFLQSGLDKVFDWKGNLRYFRDHFKASPLARVVPLMTAVITLTEVGAGVLCAVGVAVLLVTGRPDWALAGIVVAAVNLLMLFFGQRMAKDYVGAEVLANYFTLTLIGLYLMQHA